MQSDRKERREETREFHLMDHTAQPELGQARGETQKPHTGTHILALSPTALAGDWVRSEGRTQFQASWWDEATQVVVSLAVPQFPSRIFIVY